MYKKLVYAFLISLITSACGSTSMDPEEKSRRISKFIKDLSINAAWLEKKNRLNGEWERVALFYGYVDDYSACEEVKLLLLAPSQYDSEFRCTFEVGDKD